MTSPRELVDTIKELRNILGVHLETFMSDLLAGNPSTVMEFLKPGEGSRVQDQLVRIGFRSVLSEEEDALVGKFSVLIVEF